jgi:hypothetical protein
MSTIISEEEKQALIRDARKFVDATFRAAEIVEAELKRLQAPARRARPVTIDWSTGRPAIYSDNVVPFPLRHRGLK